MTSNALLDLLTKLSGPKMRSLTRPQLASTESTYLATQTAVIDSASDKHAKSKLLWSGKNRDRFRAIRAVLESISGASLRCMYCDDSAATDIDHFDPRARTPELTFVWDNYLLACSGCNSNAKRDKFPTDPTGSPLLVNPMEEDPFETLALNPANGRLLTESEKGLRTIEVFDLNRKRLTTSRIDAWVALDALIRAYDAARTANRETRAESTLSTLHEYAFAEVLATMRAYARSANDLLSEDLRDIFAARPEL